MKSVLLLLSMCIIISGLKAQQVIPAVADAETTPVVEQEAPVADKASPAAQTAAKAAPIFGVSGALPNDRIFIKPHVWAGYNIGKHKSGWGYGGGIRLLYDCRARFLGGSVFVGLEASYMAPLGFVMPEKRSDATVTDYHQQNYLVLPVILEQNYPLFKGTFALGTGVGYYKGIQANRENAVGLITNIGWFPIYKGKAITPQITYRNDWVFDKNQTNTQSICIAVNF